MVSNRWSAVGLCACVLMVFATCAAAKDSAKPTDLTLKDLHGGRVNLREHRGKIVVLNFWATWCQPCNHEMPLLVAAEKEYRARGVIFIGASLDDSKSQPRIPDFLARHEIAFPIWTGANGDDLARLRMGEAVPATAFPNRDGVIVARISGEARNEEIKERIEWLLGDRTGHAPQPFIKHLDK